VSAAGTKVQRGRVGLGASAAAVVLIACLCATGSSLSGTLLGTRAGRQAALQGRVLLDRARAVAGEPVKGVVLLTDTTKKPVTVETCAADGWLEVGLEGHNVAFGASSLLIGCKPSVRIWPGVNRFPITILTTYMSCVPPGSQSIGPTTICVPAGKSRLPTGALSEAYAEPALPPGTYHTKVILVGLPPASVPPVAVVLTAPRHQTTAAAGSQR
jgi:hypothetical protein